MVGQSGVGGGFSIDRAEITTAVRLKETEILALWVASELALRSGHLAFIKPARQAVQALLTSLPSKRRRELLAFVRRIYLGPPASAAVAASVGQVSQPLLDIIERAFTATHRLQIRYKDMQGQISQRTIEVHGLWIQAPIWYVLPFDHAKKAPRMFRVDRIMRAFPEEKRFSLRSLEIATALLTPHFDPSAMALL